MESSISLSKQRPVHPHRVVWGSVLTTSASVKKVACDGLESRRVRNLGILTSTTAACSATIPRAPKTAPRAGIGIGTGLGIGTGIEIRVGLGIGVGIVGIGGGEGWVGAAERYCSLRATLGETWEANTQNSRPGLRDWRW